MFVREFVLFEFCRGPSVAGLDLLGDAPPPSPLRIRCLSRKTFFHLRELVHTSDGFGPGPSPKARRPEAIFLGPARPEPDFFQPDPSLEHTLAYKKKDRPSQLAHNTTTFVVDSMGFETETFSHVLHASFSRNFSAVNSSPFAMRRSIRGIIRSG